MMKFRDYLGSFFLGKDYKKEKWDELKVEDIKSNSARILNLDSNVRDEINNIILRNLDFKFAKISMIKKKRYAASARGAEAMFDYVTFKSEEDEINKIIDTAYIVSFSSKLKFRSTLKVIYNHMIFKEAGYRINNYRIIILNSNSRKFQIVNFIEMDTMTLSANRAIPTIKYPTGQVYMRIFK